jgi:hypothetical protein
MTPLFDYMQALAAAVLVGKVVLLSFVVAPVLAGTLDAEAFGRVVRRLFPAYYALGMGTAAAGLAAALLGTLRGISAVSAGSIAIWLLVFAAESYCRSPLTPRSNAMRDRLKEQEREGGVDPILRKEWNRLHQRSVYLNSTVLLAGMGLVWLAR